MQRDGTRDSDDIGKGVRDVISAKAEQARAAQRQIDALTSGKVVVAVSRDDEKAIKDAFACVICKKKYLFLFSLV